MKKLTIENILHILKTKEQLKKDVESKLCSLKKDCEEISYDFLQQAALPARSKEERLPSGETFYRQVGGKSDLADVLEELQRKSEHRRAEIAEAIRNLWEYKDVIERVELCFLALPVGQRVVLQMRCIDHIKMDAVANELGMSKTTIMREERAGEETLKSLYLSNKTNAELRLLGIEVMIHGDVSHRHRKSKTSEVPGQIALFEEES